MHLENKFMILLEESMKSGWPTSSIYTKLLLTPDRYDIRVQQNAAKIWVKPKTAKTAAIPNSLNDLILDFVPNNISFLEGLIKAWRHKLAVYHKQTNPLLNDKTMVNFRYADGTWDEIWFPNLLTPEVFRKWWVATPTNRRVALLFSTFKIFFNAHENLNR